MLARFAIGFEDGPQHDGCGSQIAGQARFGRAVARYADFFEGGKRIAAFVAFCIMKRLQLGDTQVDVGAAQLACDFQIVPVQVSGHARTFTEGDKLAGERAVFAFQQVLLSQDNGVGARCEHGFHLLQERARA